MRWREQAFREVRNQLDRFLNFPVTNPIELGSYGIYNGKRCRFEWRGNLTEFGIPVPSVGFQTEMQETYATSNSVLVQSRLSLEDNLPTADISFNRTSALLFRAHDIGYDMAQLNALSQALTKAISNGMAWDSSFVIVTKVWISRGFTQLVAGGSKAAVEIKATAPNIQTDFNFANPDIGLNCVLEKNMSYLSIGQSNVRPYFEMHKLRRDGVSGYSLYKYGLPS